MAQQSITVDSSAATPNFVTQCLDPNATGLYSFTAFDLAGVVAANNYVSLFNPSGSTKTLHLYSLTYSAYIAAASSTTKNSMIVTRVTTASAGTLQAASAINKFRTGYANPVAEVRVGNPTVTLDGNIIAFAPGTTPGGYPGDRVLTSSPGGSVALAANEGIVWRTIAGDTDGNFNISFTWSET